MKKWSQDVEFFIYKCGEKSSNTSLNDSEMFRINNFQRHSRTSYTLPNLDTKRKYRGKKKPKTNWINAITNQSSNTLIIFKVVVYINTMKTTCD